MLAVNETNFAHVVLESPKPILVYFGAPWCGLCHFVRPLLQRLSQEWQDTLTVAEINADRNLRLVNTYQLKNLPTLILFQQGQVIHRLENFRVREDLHWIQDHIAPLLTLSSPSLQSPWGKHPKS